MVHLFNVSKQACLAPSSVVKEKTKHKGNKNEKSKSRTFDELKFFFKS